MGKVVVMDHPLIQHKIGLMRRTETGSKDFRTLAGEVAMFECYEATRDLELQDVEIETPICKTTVKELKGKKLAEPLWPSCSTCCCRKTTKQNNYSIASSFCRASGVSASHSSSW